MPPCRFCSPVKVRNKTLNSAHLQGVPLHCCYFLHILPPLSLCAVCLVFVPCFCSCLCSCGYYITCVRCWQYIINILCIYCFSCVLCITLFYFPAVLLPLGVLPVLPDPAASIPAASDRRAGGSPDRCPVILSPVQVLPHRIGVPLSLPRGGLFLLRVSFPCLCSVPFVCGRF